MNSIGASIQSSSPVTDAYRLTEVDEAVALIQASTLYKCPTVLEDLRWEADIAGDTRMEAIYFRAMEHHRHWFEQDKRLDAAT